MLFLMIMFLAFLWLSAIVIFIDAAVHLLSGISLSRLSRDDSPKYRVFMFVPYLRLISMNRILCRLEEEKTGRRSSMFKVLSIIYVCVAASVVICPLMAIVVFFAKRMVNWFAAYKLSEILCEEKTERYTLITVFVPAGRIFVQLACAKTAESSKKEFPMAEII